MKGGLAGIPRCYVWPTADANPDWIATGEAEVYGQLMDSFTTHLTVANMPECKYFYIMPLDYLTPVVLPYLSYCIDLIKPTFSVSAQMTLKRPPTRNPSRERR